MFLNVFAMVNENKVFYRFYCLLQNIHVPCRISLAIKTVLKFIGQQKVYVTCVHMHLFRVVNQMSLIKDLKFTTTTPTRHWIFR